MEGDHFVDLNKMLAILAPPEQHPQSRYQTMTERRPMHLTAVFQKVPEGYTGFVEELPGANTQGETLEEARKNLREAVELVLEANRALAEQSLIGQDVLREPF